MTPDEIKQQWPTFCPAPYKYIDIRRSGESPELWQTCCCNLTKHADSESLLFETIKQKQNAGIWSPACNKCYQEEQHGGLSERMRMINDLGRQQSLELEQSQQSEDFQIKITFSNLCQLACRSCVPSESSTFTKYTNSQKFIVAQARDITNDYFSKITQDIESASAQYNRIAIHINGGESMLQEGAKPVLDWMIEKNLAAETALILTTACTVMPNQRWQNYFKQFKNIGCNLSIDSVGRNYHYVRWPAQWSKVESNINWFFEYGKQNPFTNYWITPVFSLNNIFYLDEYLDYWLTTFNHYQKDYSINPISLVARTWHLDIDALPLNYRSIVAEFLDRIKQHPIFEQYPESTHNLSMWIDNTQQELQSRINQDLWPMFLRHNAYFDKSTGAEFAFYNEKFYNILTDQDRQQYAAILETINLNNSLYDYVTTPF